MITNKIEKIKQLILKSNLNDKEYIYLYNMIYNNISNKGIKTLKLLNKDE